MEKHIWVVCYINIMELGTLEKSLVKKYRRYGKLEFFVPMVKVLHKTFKRKDSFKEVPLLINYGFVKLPEHFIYNEELLRILKADVPAIWQWVQDPAKEKEKKRKRKKIPTIATVSDQEVEILKKASKDFTAFSEREVEDLQIGQIRYLRIYPFDNIMVEIMSVDLRKREARVKMLTDMNLSQTIKVSFHHLFKTIYHEDNMVDSPREAYMEDLKDLNIYRDEPMEE